MEICSHVFHGGEQANGRLSSVVFFLRGGLIEDQIYLDGLGGIAKWLAAPKSRNPFTMAK